MLVICHEMMQITNCTYRMTSIYEKKIVFSKFSIIMFILYGKNFNVYKICDLCLVFFCLFRSFSFAGLAKALLLCRLLRLFSSHSSLHSNTKIVVLLGGLVFMKPYHMPETLNILSHLILRT